MASRLPFEIILKIAQHLLTEDKIACSLTCKAWRAPFQEIVFTNIKVDSIQELEDICEIVKHPKTESVPYDQIVNGLRLIGQSTVNIQQSDIFKVLPNLKHLDLEHVEFRYADRGISSYYYPCESIVSLKLKIQGEDNDTSTEVLLELLENLPNLRKLDISPYSSHMPVRLTTKTLNKLHRAAPYLTSLTLRAELTAVNWNAIAMFSFTKQALHMTKLDLDILEWDYMWIYYFCYKYPNLRTFRWNTSPDTYAWVSGDDTYSALLLRSATEAFKHVETFEFNSEDIREWTDTNLWGLLSRNTVSLKNIKHTNKNINCSAAYQDVIVQQMLEDFSKTLETLFIEGNVHFKFYNIVRRELSYCPRLVDLELKNCGLSIALDDMLDKFTALRRFSFSNGQLYLNSDRPEDSIGHGLHTVELNQVVANASVYNYLSFRCRGLEYMTLAQCRICGSIPDNSERMLIDMSYTTFKSLHLDEVKSYSSEQRTTKDTILNLLTISQSTRAIHSSKESEIDDINPDVIHISWYHFFWESDYTFDYIIKIRKMPMDERTTALKYYYDPKSRKARAFSDMERSVNGQVTREYWEQDLCRGYAEFRCSHIAKLTVNVLQ